MRDPVMEALAETKRLEADAPARYAAAQARRAIELEKAERRAKQQVERRFMLTSHGALHKPSCSNLKRLKVPAKEVWLGPNDPKPKGSHLAECCWQYGSWQAVLYGWRYTEAGELIE